MMPIAELRVSAWLLPGQVVFTPWTRTFYVRHMSEAFLLFAGASWHPDGERCPTWTDECRCMLGGEA